MKKNLTNNKIFLYIVLILSLILNIVYFAWLTDIFETKTSNFQNITNYNLWKNDDNVLKTINNDFRPLLSTYFWKIKLDKNMLLKDNGAYHVFYFSEKVPNLNSVISLVLPELEKKWYIEKTEKDSRTYELKKKINGKEYSIIFNILSYKLEDKNNDDKEDMWIFMLYIKK